MRHKRYSADGARFARGLAARREMHDVCHVITDLRASVVPGMFELYCKGRIMRLAMRGGAPVDPGRVRASESVLVLMGEPLGSSMDELRRVIGSHPSLGAMTLVVHGTATGWRVQLGQGPAVRMQPAEVHPLVECGCVFWLGGHLARAGRGVREGWYRGELIEAVTHPDGVEGDLRALLHRLMTADDPYEALGVERRLGARALNAAYLALMASHMPERVHPAESERRLDLHRRIREAAIRVIGLSEAA